VVELIASQFAPAQFHIRHDAPTFDRFKAQWTPTLLVIDAHGEEQHRIEGFLGVDDFLAELEIGLGRAAFAAAQFGEAERWFARALEEHPDSIAAPKARYWAGVARYKATGKADPLRDTAIALHARWPDSEWARKASVWAA